MTYRDPLDGLPLIPNDWANHIVYGMCLAVVCILCGMSRFESAMLVLGTASVKKIADYAGEHESLSECVGKTVVTALFPIIGAAIHAVIDKAPGCISSPL